MSENKLDGSKGVIMLGNNNAMSQIKGPEVKESVDDNINSSEILDLNTLDEPFMDTLVRLFLL